MIKSANLLFLLLLFFILGLASIGCAQGSYGHAKPADKLKPSSYKECVAAGYPALRSYPGKCVADGETFVDDSVRTPKLRQPQPEAICVDMCGDGDCQEIVCQGSGCPCSECQESCPEDCGS